MYSFANWFRGSTPAARRRPTFRPSLELLEAREVPSANSYDIYAMGLINAMRVNPAAFGQDLLHLYQGGSYVSPTGMSASDPVWSDIRADIKASEGNNGWFSGFSGQTGTTFLSVISSLPTAAPLALLPEVQQGAENHTAWMFANGFAHSGQEPSFAIPGIPFHPTATPDSFLTDSKLTAQGEDIGYSVGEGSYIYQAFVSNPAEYYKRVAYKDTIGFILDNHNGNPALAFGHLKNLANVGFNVFGVDIHNFKDTSVPGTNPSDGLNESWLTTHRLGHYLGDLSGLQVPQLVVSSGSYIGSSVAAVSVAFDSQNHQWTAAVYSDGSLYVFYPGGHYYVGGSVLSASIAFNHQGQEVLDVVFASHQLWSYDVSGAHFIGNSVNAVSVAFDSLGHQFTAAVFEGSGLYVFDPSGFHFVAPSVMAVSLAFDTQGREVLDLVYSDQNLYQFDSAGAHYLGGGIVSVGLGFNHSGGKVLDVVFASSELWQY